MSRILIGLILGLAVGPWAQDGVSGLAELSRWVIQLIKALAVPLLFLAIVNAVNRTHVDWRSGGKMVLIASLNASFALLIGMGLSLLLRPGDGLKGLFGSGGASTPAGVLPAGQELKLDWMKNLAAWIPQSALQPFVENAVIPVVILAVLLGLALRHEREASPSDSASQSAVLEQWSLSLEAAQKVAERMLLGVTKLIPVAVFAAVASSVAKFGYAPLKGLFPYVGVALLGLTLHVATVYQLWIGFGSPIRLSHFWREARVPCTQAVGTNSSLATLPFTLRALDRLGVSRKASALGACVGTNLNNDGILLYEGMAFLTVAQALGMNLGFSQQLSAAAICLLTGLGIAGVPDAGFISLSLVLTAVGVPIENLPLLLSVDWILGRARSVTNVLSDMTLSIAIDGQKKSEPQA